MNIEIERLTHKGIDDFSDLIKVFEIIFEWDNFSLPTKSHLQRLLSNESFLVFVAKKDEKVVGGLTAYILDKYDNEKSSVYIYDIAVLTEQQRKGIGKLLITTLNHYCEKNGFDEVFVQAETEDTQAINFYRTTPISKKLKATQFIYSFDTNFIKPIRF